MISGLLSLAAAVIYLIRTGHLKLPPRVWRMSQLILLRHVGVPVFVSYCLIFLSTLFYNGIISPYGESVIAGFGVGYRIQTMAILPGIVIGSAIGIIINQNMAEKKGERAYEGFKTGMQHSYAAYVLDRSRSMAVQGFNRFLSYCRGSSPAGSGTVFEHSGTILHTVGSVNDGTSDDGTDRSGV